MAAQSVKTSRSRVLTQPVVVLWFASLFLFPPAAQWLDILILVLAFLVLPLVALGIWLAGVPLWAFGMTLVRLWQRRRLEALRYFAVLPIGVAIAFTGWKCGDLIAVMTYGALLKNEVEAVKAGATPKASDGIFSSSLMAFKLTGGFLDISVGIAYDESGQADRMMALSPSARPADWQRNAVDVMKCEGGARRLFYNFYRVTVSSYSC